MGRWCEHRYHLRRGTHNSPKLQRAFDERGDYDLKFEILETCTPDALDAREEFHIVALDARLNSAKLINNAWNIWADPEVRAKFATLHASIEWKKKHSNTIKSTAWMAGHRIAVVTDTGLRFSSMAEAALFYGVTVSRIKYLATAQNRGNFGVRFRFEGAAWLKERSGSERATETRRASGKLWHSADTREKMRENRKHWKPTRKAINASVEANRVPVIGTSLKTWTEREFPSIRDAARSVRPANYRTATCQIVKACSGVKKSAYGYTWRRAA